MPDKLLTSAEAAEILHVSKQTVMKWVASGRLKRFEVMPGRKRKTYRFRLDDIREFMAAESQKAVDTLAAPSTPDDAELVIDHSRVTAELAAATDADVLRALLAHYNVGVVAQLLNVADADMRRFVKEGKLPPEIRKTAASIIDGSFFIV